MKKIGLVAALIAWAIMCIPGYEEVVSYVWNTAVAPVVVIDAGHGGIDGGAESIDGIAEKDVNLSIAMFLKEELKDENIRVVMTREDENGLYGEHQGEAIRTLKTRDMHERKRIIDEMGAELTVSIHLNSFTQDTSVKGAQVFYPLYGDEDLTGKSKTAAEFIQASLNEGINEENARTELGKDDVFLLKNITCPIVIAECGFLSNPEELEKIKTEEWQKKVASYLKEGICTYLKKEAEKTEN